MEPRDDSPILIVDDTPGIREALQKILTKEGFTVFDAEDGEQAVKILQQQSIALLLTDLKMPKIDGAELLKIAKTISSDIEVILITGHGTVEIAVDVMKDGAFDYITKPFDPDDLTHLIRNATRQLKLEEENETLRSRLVKLEHVEDLVGNSEAMKQLLHEIENLAQTNASVIITGESGTGKELVARAIHTNSSRRFFPFVSVHCGALSESLLESELFGHEKGAFTGAVYNRKGRFEMADSGSIFLDEISTISQKMQVELLRVLESKTFMRVGGNKEITSDFRVICATNKDLKGMVKAGTFREDLYYRLNVVNIQVPPLRERVSDIPLLVDFFIRKYCTSMNRPPVTIEAQALKRLKEFSFPGNIRELENMIERAIVVGDGRKISLRDLPFDPEVPPPASESLEDFERSFILSVLTKYNWNISHAAKALKVDRVTLYNKIRKYGLKAADPD